MQVCKSQIYTKFMLNDEGVGVEKLRVRAQIEEIIQGFTFIFRVVGLFFFMVSGNTSSNELKNAIKS